jgi:hypothetical protein
MFLYFDGGVIIFDDTAQEKTWTDENEIMYWHYDHCKGRSVKGYPYRNRRKMFGLRMNLICGIIYLEAGSVSKGLDVGSVL